MGDSISQDDLNALFNELSSEKKETTAIKTDNTGGSISQDDLDALFGELSLEIKETPPQEAKSAESASGSENLSQDEIDELLKMLNG